MKELSFPAQANRGDTPMPDWRKSCRGQLEAMASSLPTNFASTLTNRETGEVPRQIARLQGFGGR